MSGIQEGSTSPNAGKNKEKRSSRRASSDEELVPKTKKKRSDRQEMVFAPRDDNETVVAQSARVLAILALMRSTSGNAHKEFVIRDSDIAINITRFFGAEDEC
jgi:hypothetical protein